MLPRPLFRIVQSLLVFAASIAPCHAQWGELAWARRSAFQSIPLGYSDSGATLVASLNGFLRRWNIATGELLSTSSEWSVLSGIPNGRSVSPDGRLMAWKPRNDTLAIREVATGRVISSVPAYGVMQVYFTSDGNQLVAFNELGTVIYSVPQLVALRLIPGGRALALSPDDASIARYDTGSVARYLTSTGERLWNAPYDNTHYLSHLAFADSGRAIIAYGPRMFHLLDARTGDSLAMFEHDYVTAYDNMTFVQRGRYAVGVTGAFSGNASMRVWDVTNRRHLRDVALDSALFPIRHVMPSPNDRDVIISCGNGRFAEVDMQTGAIVREFPNAIDREYARRVISRNGNVSAIAGPAGITFIRTETGETLRRIRPTSAYTALALSNGGQLLAVATELTVEVWNVAAGAHVTSISVFKPTALTFIDNGQRLLIAHSDRKLGIWPTQPVAADIVFPQFPFSIHSLALSKDEQMIAALDFRNRILILDRQGRILYQRQTKSSFAEAQLAFAPDARSIFISGPNNSLLKYRLDDSGDTTETVVYSTRFGVWSVAITPDERYVIAGADDPIAFDLTSLQEAYRFVDSLSGEGGIPVMIDGEGRMIMKSFDITMWRMPQIPSTVEQQTALPTATNPVVVDHAYSHAKLKLVGTSAQDASVMVRNALGRSVFVPIERISGDAFVSLNISALQSGSYFITAIVDEAIVNARFVVAR
ncbi:MAG: PQQ-binding-like beta-propeller repeat protein [bacterium]|nr:PQQ-binding-like beta-propeller repeat protein [Candidatus Kapabacteria bacterium]